MKKLILILVSCFLLTGCSLVKAVVSPFKPTQTTLPQQTQKSKEKYICKSKLVLHEDGSVKSCDRGFYAYSENFNQVERKLTLKERIIQFFEKLQGYAFWGVVLLLIFCPSALGFIFGRIMEGIFGIGAKAFKQVSSAIQKVKTDSPNLITELEKSTDEDVKKFITKFKQDNNIK